MELEAAAVGFEEGGPLDFDLEEFEVDLLPLLLGFVCGVLELEPAAAGRGDGLGRLFDPESEPVRVWVWSYVRLGGFGDCREKGLLKGICD